MSVQNATLLPQGPVGNRHRASPRETLLRNRMQAGFMSQLIVSRAHQPTIQPPVRPTNLAVDAYRRASANKIRRMPAGYGFSEDA